MRGISTIALVLFSVFAHNASAIELLNCGPLEVANTGQPGLDSLNAARSAANTVRGTNVELAASLQELKAFNPSTPIEVARKRWTTCLLQAQITENKTIGWPDTRLAPMWNGRSVTAISAEARAAAANNPKPSPATQSQPSSQATKEAEMDKQIVEGQANLERARAEDRAALAAGLGQIASAMANRNSAPTPQRNVAAAPSATNSDDTCIEELKGIHASSRSLLEMNQRQKALFEGRCSNHRNAASLIRSANNTIALEQGGSKTIPATRASMEKQPTVAERTSTTQNSSGGTSVYKHPDTGADCVTPAQSTQRDSQDLRTVAFQNICSKSFAIFVTFNNTGKGSATSIYAGTPSKPTRNSVLCKISTGECGGFNYEVR